MAASFSLDNTAARVINYSLWSPPVRGSFKLNVDAALLSCNDSNAVGLGCVVRNDVGGFVAVMAKKVLAGVTPLEAESRGLREGLILFT